MAEIFLKFDENYKLTDPRSLINPKQNKHKESNPKAHQKKQNKTKRLQKTRIKKKILKADK